MKNPMEMPWKRAVIGMLVLLGLAVVLSACGDEESPVLPAKGLPMPEFSLMSLDGESVSSSELFRAKVVVLNVWATWCPPCRQEMPDLIRLSRLLPRDRFLVVGLAVDSHADDVRAFMRDHGIVFPVFWDQNGKQVAAPRLGVFKYPETFVINREGVVVEKVNGAFPWADPEVVAILHAIEKTGRVPPQEG